MCMTKLIHGGDIYNEDDGSVCNWLDFSANINPLGLPQGVRRAITDNIDSYTSYPDPLCRELKAAIAMSEGIDTKYIVCGNGAADLIFRLVLCTNPQKAIVIAPTFAEYETALSLVHCTTVHHYLSEENGFYLDNTILQKISADVDIMFVCNPNNPTGIPVKTDLMQNIVEQCKRMNVLLVVDECFNDFLDNNHDYSMIPYLKDYNNMILLKAFTKMYAMAGIRLGYALCSDVYLTQKIESTLQPWSVSTVASKCGIAALSSTEYVKKTKQLIHDNRTFLIGELKKLGIKVFDSAANFIFFKTDEIELDTKLKEHGILIRSCSNYVGLSDNYYRIAVKGHEDNLRLIEALRYIHG